MTKLDLWAWICRGYGIMHTGLCNVAAAIFLGLKRAP